MNTLSRHLVRAMFGPFLFALSALTGILFLSAVAEQMDNLSGKGLGWEVITEFLLLTLPHTLALTFPMAILVAVLHAFSEMASANEITAMKAGGISPRNILRPLLGVGVAAAAVVFVFNDRILPEANHRLKNLLLDINRKSPTFVLKEQAVNRLEAVDDGRVFHLIAAEIDNQRNALKDIRVVDQNDPMHQTITWADSAVLGFSSDRTDLFMTMFDGVSIRTTEQEPGAFERTNFEQQRIRFDGIDRGFDRASASTRGEREMTFGQLADNARRQDERLVESRADILDLQVAAVRAALGHEVADSALTRGVSATENALAFATSQVAMSNYDRLTSEVRQRTNNLANSQPGMVLNARKYRVELHKKIALAFACIVFVILGAPLAIRWPNGGLGLVIAASTAIFSIYWVGLIGGEKLADRGFVSPWIAMWLTNAVFLALGVFMYRRMGTETGSNRGGGLDDLLWTLGGPVRALRERRTARAGGGA
jgi:lipopolysaccharide export system permease protein